VSSISFSESNLIGNLFLQHGHLQNTRDIVKKAINNTIETIPKILEFKGEAKNPEGIDINKNIRDNFLYLLIFLTLRGTVNPPFYII